MKLPLPAILGLILLTSELLLAFAKRSRVGTTGKDANSLRLLWFVIMISIFFALRAQAQWLTATLPNRHAFAVTGVILFVAGLILRWYSILQLGRFFTVDVAIAADHQLVDSGPYRLVRHPSYTGALIAFAGFALSLGNWAAFLVMLVPIFFAFVFRMNVEERALIAALGPRYLDYSRRTKRLIPFIY